MDWVLDPKGYPVAKVEVPESAAALANFSRKGRVLMFMAGGVLLQYTEPLNERQTDEAGVIKQRQQAVADGAWIAAQGK